MSIHLITATPRKLLTAFKKDIDMGHIVTWSYDNEEDFTHDVDQWRNRAWLKPIIKDDRLLLTILPPKDEKLDVEVYAIYHGRFIEAMLAHCDELFTQGRASAKPSDGDKV